jgi:radical SAM protein with 4Fe4S-binding SPASM domain
MLFSGEGEPLLHKDFSQLAQAAFSSGIDIALATNGVLLKDEFIDSSLELFKWIKISIAAGRPETYAMIHRTGFSDFGKVFTNLNRAVQRKKEKGLSTAIGAQLLALPENVDEVLELAELCDKTGLNYLVVKPFSQNELSLNSCYRDIDYNGLMAKLQKIEYKSDSDFHLIIRYQSITRAAVEENIYNICRAVPYAWCHIMTNGDVYACGAWLDDRRFLLGNVNESSFAEIWEGDRRREVIEMMRTFSTGVCRINCRMSQINEYLHQLQNPGAHVNFI